MKCCHHHNVTCSLEAAIIQWAILSVHAMHVHRCRLSVSCFCVVMTACGWKNNKRIWNLGGHKWDFEKWRGQVPPVPSWSYALTCIHIFSGKNCSLTVCQQALDEGLKGCTWLNMQRMSRCLIKPNCCIWLYKFIFKLTSHTIFKCS